MPILGLEDLLPPTASSGRASQGSRWPGTCIACSSLTQRHPCNCGVPQAKVQEVAHEGRSGDWPQQALWLACLWLYPP